jgi:hypothetical protein
MVTRCRPCGSLVLHRMHSQGFRHRGLFVADVVWSGVQLFGFDYYESGESAIAVDPDQAEFLAPCELPFWQRRHRWHEISKYMATPMPVVQSPRTSSPGAQFSRGSRARR